MITPTETLILSLLVGRRGGAYPSELLQASDGRLKRGSIYTLLSRLEAEGLVKSEEESTDEDGGVPRTRYRITGAGIRARSEFAEWIGLAAGGAKA